MAWNLEDVQDNVISKCIGNYYIVIVKVIKLAECAELFGGQIKHYDNL